MSAFDFEGLLSLDGLRDTQIKRVSRSAFYPDGAVEISFEGLPHGSYSEASDWLVSNRQVIEDAQIGDTLLEGKWRTVSVEESEPDKQHGTTLVWKLAKGLYTSIDWRFAKVVDRDKSPGSNQAPPGVASGQSEIFRETVDIDLPYFDPVAAQAVVTALTTPAYQNLILRDGITLSGAWLFMSAVVREEDDNTSTIKIVLGRPIFTIEGYRDHDTWEKEARYYVANVPQARVQAVMDEWKTLAGGAERKGAAAVVEGFHPERGTANLILTVPMPTQKLNQRTWEEDSHAQHKVGRLHLNQASAETPRESSETEGEIETVRVEETPLGLFNNEHETDTSKYQGVKATYKSTIDQQTKVEEHNAIARAELADFLDGTLDVATRETNSINFQETLPDNLRGVQRSIRIDVRPDGRLNLAGESREPNAVADDLDPDIGESCTTLHTVALYWNQSKVEAELVLAALATQEAGVFKQVDIQRNGLGQFDIRVSEKTYTEATASGAIAGDGVQVEVETGIRYTQVELDAALAELTANKRERVRLDVRVDDNCQANWTASKQTVVAGTSTELGSGVGVVDKAKGYSNADTPETPPAAAKRKRVRPQVQVNDDGTYSGGYQSTEVVETEASKNIATPAPGPNIGVQIRTQLIENADDADHISFTPGPRKRHNLNLRANDDGTLSGAATEQEVQEGEADAALDVPSVGTPPPGIRVQARAVTNKDDLSDLVHEITTGPRKRHSLSVQAADDGTVSGSLVEQEVVETEGTKSIVTLSGPAEGVQIRSKFIENADDATHIDFTPGPRKRHNLNVRANDDGTLSGGAIEQEVPEVVPDDFGYDFGILDPTGIVETQHVGANFDAEDLTIPQPGPGVRVSPQVQVNDDGTLSGGYRKTELPEAKMTEKRYGASLLQIERTAMTNGHTQPDMADYVDTAGVTVRFEGRMVEDGAIVWDQVKETAVATSAVANGGSLKSDLTLTLEMTPYRNQPLLVEALPNPILSDVPTAIGEEVSFIGLRINDNDTFDVMKVKTTLAVNTSQPEQGHYILAEWIWQKRDQPLRTWGYPSAGEWIYHFTGRRQKRPVKRAIRRKFFIERPSLPIASLLPYGAEPTTEIVEDWRITVGEMNIGGVTLYHVDRENVDIGEWESDIDGNDSGIYYETGSSASESS